MSRILVVDDDAEFLKMISLLFRLSNLDTTTVESGQSALDLLAKENFDLVILDVMMPGLSGYAVCREMQKDARLARIPVVFLSAKGEKKDVIEGLSSGANDYIAKPFEAEILIAKVNAMLEHKRLSDELAIKNEMLKNLAITDDLTGAHNHRHFVNKLADEFERAVRGNLPLSLIMMDLDFFKTINDTYGHLTGDAVLRELSTIVMNNIRKYDTFARYGGEEFALILPQTVLDGALREAERLRFAVETARFSSMKNAGDVTMSCGVAVFPSKMVKQAEDMVKFADMALYEAKKNGRNRIEALALMQEVHA